MIGKILAALGGNKEQAEDPICHMQVDVAKPPGGTHEYNGVTYYFCAPGCRVAFSKEPEAYLSGEKRMDMGH